MEFVLPFAGAGFALGWPMEWVIQRFPTGKGTAPSVRHALAHLTPYLGGGEVVVQEFTITRER